MFRFYDPCPRSLVWVLLECVTVFFPFVSIFFLYEKTQTSSLELVLALTSPLLIRSPRSHLCSYLFSSPRPLFRRPKLAVTGFSAQNMSWCPDPPTDPNEGRARWARSSRFFFLWFRLCYGQNLSWALCPAAQLRYARHCHEFLLANPFSLLGFSFFFFFFWVQCPSLKNLLAPPLNRDFGISFIKFLGSTVYYKRIDLDPPRLKPFKLWNLPQLANC